MPSAVIRRIEYDEAQRELRVTFVSGDVYAYEEVPQAAYAAFRGAFAKGVHFSRHVRNRYRSRLVCRTGEDEAPEPSTPVLL